MRVIFFLEERSMEEFLEGLLGRLFPSLVFKCVVYSGWSDLERSVPGTLRSWHVPGDRFVICRDGDGRNCHAIKQRIVDSCKEAGREDVLVRIVCQELEAWYLGDFAALDGAYPDSRVLQHQGKARYRNPDSIRNPSGELARLVGSFRKMEAARRMGSLIDVGRNRSGSFRVFVAGVGKMAGELG